MNRLTFFNRSTLLCILAFAGVVNAQTVEYIHTDALGTPIAVTDVNRNVIEKSEYEPYGQQLSGPEIDGPGYTGHVQDNATGLIYMQQRYYDPLVGRFLSTDPIAAYANPVGQFNRFRYVNNNPYSLKDPDGRAPVSDAVQRMRNTSDGIRTSFISPLDTGQAPPTPMPAEHVWEGGFEMADRISKGENFAPKDEDGDGDNSCAELIKSKETFGAPHTSIWREGRRIRPGMKIDPGTAIATFDSKGRYPQRSDVKHAAIFIGFAEGNGIYVLDQWDGLNGIQYRRLEWNVTQYNDHTNHVNSASNFSTITW